MGRAIVDLVHVVFSLLNFLIIVWAVMSWLVFFDIINTRNRFVYQVLDMLDRMISPLVKPIRRIVPPLGSVDVSGIILILILFFLERVFDYVAAPMLINLLG